MAELQKNTIWILYIWVYEEVEKSLRKLKLQVQISIDGYIAGPNGEMDWMVWNWDDKLKNCVFEITESVDTIILGRKMTDGFISEWSNIMTQTTGEVKK